MNANFRAQIPFDCTKDFAKNKERYLRKNNEKIVTAYKLAIVMQGINKKAFLSPARPSVTVESEASNSENRAALQPET